MDRVVIGANGGMRFNAARIIAHGDCCEPLHGRDFYVQATLTGRLGETGRVIDFRTVGTVLTRFCAAYTGRILAPLRNSALVVERDGDMWHIVHPSRRWSLPACDVLALEVVNPTNEVLAALLLDDVRRALRDDPEAGVLAHLEVTVGDAEGIALHSEPWDVAHTAHIAHAS